MTKVTENLHLPWNSNELKSLLLEIVKIGETSKIDFKQEISIGIDKEKSELLKDISAIANTQEPNNYQNYGFILIGVKHNEIIGSSFLKKFKVDNLQATIDNLISQYLDPFIKTQVITFDEEGKVWGAIVIPPAKGVPHVFTRDIGNKHRGDVYVRRGTITEKALPEDYARFFRQTDEDSSKEDRIKEILLSEAHTVRSFLESDAIPWDLRIISKKDGEKLLNTINEKAEAYWQVLAKTILKDDEGEYNEVVIQTIKELADYYEPSNGGCTYLGRHIRYYPLVIALYVTFAVGAFKKRDAILRKISDIKLVGRLRELFSIVYSLSSYSVYSSSFSLSFIPTTGKIFHTQCEEHPQDIKGESLADRLLHPRKYETHSQDVEMESNPIVRCIRSLFDQKVRLEGCQWDSYKSFFISEFLISLVSFDVTNEDIKNGSAPPPFLQRWLYMYSEDAILIIKKYWRKECDWIRKIFRRPLRDVSREFATAVEKCLLPGVPDIGTHLYMWDLIQLLKK